MAARLGPALGEESGLRRRAGRRRLVAHFDLALRIEPAPRGRASSEADRCRDTIAAQRAIDERAEALLEESAQGCSRETVAGRHRPVQRDALLVDSVPPDATALKRTQWPRLRPRLANAGRNAERARPRGAFRRKGRFEEATLEIARARGSIPQRIWTPWKSVSEPRLPRLSARSYGETKRPRRSLPRGNALPPGRRDEALTDPSIVSREGSAPDGRR